MKNYFLSMQNPEQNVNYLFDEHDVSAYGLRHMKKISFQNAKSAFTSKAFSLIVNSNFSYMHVLISTSMIQ